MPTFTTRRRCIEIISITGVTLLTACKPKKETVPSPSVSTSPPSAAPAPVNPASVPVPAAPVSPSAPASGAMDSLPALEENESAAMALGYVKDANRADKVKFNNYVPGSQCGNCAVYLGRVGDVSGGCRVFPGKSVMARGWCSAWVKKV